MVVPGTGFTGVALEAAFRLFRERMRSATLPDDCVVRGPAVLVEASAEGRVSREVCEDFWGSEAFVAVPSKPHATLLDSQSVSSIPAHNSLGAEEVSICSHAVHARVMSLHG